MNAYVYFLGADLPRLSRLARRSRRGIVQYAAAWLTIKLTRSKMIHASVGDDTHTGACGIGYVAVWETAVYRTSPDILGWFCVPISTPIHPIRIAYSRPVASIWPSLLQFATFNKTPAHNCMSVVSGVLRDGGINVPRAVNTPAKLHQWLTLKGYDYVYRHR